jgi:hypothetical protein
VGTGLEKNEKDKGGDDAGHGKPVGESHRKRVKGRWRGRKDVWGVFAISFSSSRASGIMSTGMGKKPPRDDRNQGGEK